MRKILYLFVGGMAIMSSCGGNLPGANEATELNEVSTAIALGVQRTEEARFSEQTESAGGTATNEVIMGATLTRAAVLASFVRTAAAPKTAIVPGAEAIPVMEQLVEEGYIRSTDGKFRKLPDFERLFSLRDWFQRYPTDSTPNNFVMRALLSLDSDEDNNLTVAGCGFAFRMTSENTGNYVLIDVRGSLRFGVIGPDYWYAHGIEPNVVGNPLRAFEIWLVVQDKVYYVFVEGEEVCSFTAEDQRGGIWYWIAAGSEDITCLYEDVWVWTISD